MQIFFGFFKHRIIFHMINLSFKDYNPSILQKKKKKMVIYLRQKVSLAALVINATFLEWKKYFLRFLLYKLCVFLSSYISRDLWLRNSLVHSFQKTTEAR